MDPLMDAVPRGVVEAAGVEADGAEEVASDPESPPHPERRKAAATITPAARLNIVMVWGVASKMNRRIDSPTRFSNTRFDNIQIVLKAQNRETFRWR